MIVGVAIYGAVLGLLVRPAVRAVVLAALSVGVSLYAAAWLSHLLSHRAGTAGLVWVLDAFSGDIVTMASTAAAGAGFTALIAAFGQSSEQRRRVRRVAAIED